MYVYASAHRSLCMSMHGTSHNSTGFGLCQHPSTKRSGVVVRRPHHRIFYSEVNILQSPHSRQLPNGVIHRTYHNRYMHALHCMAWHGMAWHGMAWHGMAWHGMAWHGFALHCIALHCIALHCIALHCIALHCIALHCMTFHYIA